MIRRIVLVGFMGSGKSTVAAALARRWNWRFVDFDVEIERQVGMPIRDFIARFGEARFRLLEADLTERLAREREVVVAPGGGWVTQPELLSAFRREGLIIWLQASPADVLRRLKWRRGGHPFQARTSAAGSIRHLMRQREHLFKQADLSICTADLTHHQVVLAIEEYLREGGRFHISRRRSIGMR